MIDALRSHNVKQPIAVVEEAQRANILVCSALAMLEMETGIPQRNIFGHDPGGPFPGEKVTKEKVAELRRRQIPNGVGWTQLTYLPFVAQADREGGAHIPRFQMRVGFQILRDNFDRLRSLHAMFAAYNGSGPAAEAYGTKAVGLREKWLAITKE